MSITYRGETFAGYNKPKRFEIRAEEAFIRKLEELAIASGTSKADVIDRAVGLYAHALKQAQEGKEIYFEYPTR